MIFALYLGYAFSILLLSILVSKMVFIFSFNSSVTSVFRFFILVFRLKVIISDVVKSLMKIIIRIIPIIVRVLLFMLDSKSSNNGFTIYTSSRPSNPKKKAFVRHILPFTLNFLFE